MTLYELFDSSTNNLDGWLDHLSGIYRLLQHRGPAKHNNTASLTLFEHSRYLIMLQHLVSRKASVLGQPDWLDRPWQDVKKSVEPKVFDEGLKLTSVFERCDLAMKGGSTEVDLSELFTDCVEIYHGISHLQEHHLSSLVKPDLEPKLLPAADNVIVQNPAALMLNITALGVKLGACKSACDVYQRTSKLLGTADIEVPDSMANRAKLLNYDRRQMAQQIIQSVQICNNERVGAMGAARMIFSLQLAIREFEPGSPEMLECWKMLRQLSDLGHRFKALMRAVAPDESTTVPEDVDLIRENAGALAGQWQHMAETHAGISSHSQWMPAYVERLPCEVLATWAK